MAYTAVVLTEESRLALLDKVVSGLHGDRGLPVDWVIKAHHMTVDMKPASKSMAADFVGQTVTLEVLRLGVGITAPNEGIIAVEVKCCVPSKNAIKHVTICHHQNVKPVKSNDITNWTDAWLGEEPLVLTGVVQEVA
jgi:Fungal tRNA ligase phosphodiesterase domain